MNIFRMLIRKSMGEKKTESMFRTTILYKNLTMKMQTKKKNCILLHRMSGA